MSICLSCWRRHICSEDRGSLEELRFFFQLQLLKKDDASLPSNGDA